MADILKDIQSDYFHISLPLPENHSIKIGRHEIKGAQAISFPYVYFQHGNMSLMGLNDWYHFFTSHNAQILVDHVRAGDVPIRAHPQLGEDIALEDIVGLTEDSLGGVSSGALHTGKEMILTAQKKFDVPKAIYALRQLRTLTFYHSGAALKYKWFGYGSRKAPLKEKAVAEVGGVFDFMEFPCQVGNIFKIAVNPYCPVLP